MWHFSWKNQGAFQLLYEELEDVEFTFRSLTYLDLFCNAGEVRKWDTVTNSSSQRMEQNSTKAWTMFLKSWKKKKEKRNPPLISSRKKNSIFSALKRDQMSDAVFVTDTNSTRKIIQISLVRFQASDKPRPKQQFTVNCALTPCYSSPKRYLRSAGSRSALRRFGGLFCFFFRPDEGLDSSPRRTPPEKIHRIQALRFFFLPPPPSICRLFAFFHAAPPSVFLSLAPRESERDGSVVPQRLLFTFSSV